MLGLLFTAAGLLSPIAPSPVLPSQPTLDLLWKKMGSWAHDSVIWGHSREDEGRTVLPAATVPSTLLRSCHCSQLCFSNSAWKTVTACDLILSDPWLIFLQRSFPEGSGWGYPWLQVTSTPPLLVLANQVPNSASNQYRTKPGPEKDFCPIERNMAVDSFSSRWSPVLSSLSKFRETLDFFSRKIYLGERFEMSYRCAQCLPPLPSKAQVAGASLLPCCERHWKPLQQ